MDQSSEVFRIVFIHFTFFEIQKCKSQRFCENIFGCVFIKSKCMCLQTGPGDLKNTKHLKFDFLCIFLKNEKITFSENLKNHQ